MDESIPILGVNSDPTKTEEVEEFSNEFDATRSTGYFCVATVKNFEQVLDSFLESQTVPSKLSRISVSVNSKVLPTYALNDILIAQPCTATVSRFSFKINNCNAVSRRICNAYFVSRSPIYAREPILPGAVISSDMHGLIKSDQSLDAAWFCKEGLIYVDGSHIFYTIQNGDTIEISSKAPVLQVILPPHL